MPYRPFLIPCLRVWCAALIVVIRWGDPACAQSADSGERLSVTSYFPAPSGVHSVVELYPQTVPPVDPQPGQMYYDRSRQMAFIWTGGTWLSWAQKQALGECDIRISSESAIQGVTMRALQKGCEIFCDGKGLAYLDVFCVDRREVRDSDGTIYAYSWFDFHSCKRDLHLNGGSATHGQFYCHANGQTTKAYCYCQSK